VELDLESAARLVAGHCWVESRMFEIVGSWVTSTSEVSVKLMLDRHSRHHAWRAGQWWDRLPELADVDRDALVAAAGGRWTTALREVEAMETTVARLAAAYRAAVPRLCVAYARHRASASPVRDGSALWTLGMVGADAAADWAEGEVALQALLLDRAAVDQASQAARDVELLFCEGSAAR
jgi:hypothetical protein